MSVGVDMSEGRFSSRNTPLVTFYGDDFTGSSENLAQFHRNGLRARLYLAVPPADELRRAAGELHVLGIAGTARALSPAEMDGELEAAFRAMRQVAGPFVQYKICSTFDSAPGVGSFGKVLDVAGRHFPGHATPVLAATPDFGRYTAFGQHFARFGADIARLDRHPSMSAHPRTPMAESDLRLHLAAQTPMPFVNVMLPALRAAGPLAASVAAAFGRGEGVVFDGVENDDLDIVCRLLWSMSGTSPIFALAAQGLAQRLGRHLAREVVPDELRAVRTAIAPVRSLIVLSGSCAIQTARQIDAAEQAGWRLCPLDPARLADARSAADEVERLAGIVCEASARGHPCVIYTARGLAGRLAEADAVPASRLGPVYADLLARVRSRVDLPRAVLAGGDSASYAVRHCGAVSLEISVFDAAQNSHVCRLSGPGTPVDGLEVMLKGGQIGADDFFLRAMAGTA